jgi:hypothetical protein
MWPKDSRVYAKRLVDRIREKVQLLKDFPELGAKVEDWETKNIREIQEGLPHYLPYKDEFCTNLDGTSRRSSIARTRKNSGEGSINGPFNNRK